MFWVLLAVLVLIVVSVIGLYNRMASLKVRTQEAWSDIETQLKRRYDLIPNLVETVKGYAGHERKAFEEVTRLRSQAMGASTVAGKAEAETSLAQALKTVFAVAEAYPELKANQNFLSLQQNLGEIEEAIQNSRRYYNAVARDYNTQLVTFPGNIVAGFFNFRPVEFFEIADAEKAAPKVSFSS